MAWSISDTLPLINTWKEHGHTIYDIDASKSEDEIFEEVKKAIQK